MRVALIADVHANLPALEAVLREAERAGADGLLCAGDLVGYGPFPNECIARVRGAATACVAGNHDLIALGRLTDDRCVPSAKQTLAWTRTVLSDDARAYLQSLPGQTRAADVLLAHGSLDDPEEYVASEARAREELRRAEAPVLVLGHTHRPALWRVNGSALVNPGAVGHSRGLRTRASFALLEDGEVAFRSVEYDVGRCRDALRTLGLPPSAYRLPVTPRRIARALERRARRVVA